MKTEVDPDEFYSICPVCGAESHLGYEDVEELKGDWTGSTTCRKSDCNDQLKKRVERMNILSKHVDSLVITKKKPGRLAEVESGNEVIVIISNDEVVLHNDYEMKTVPVTEINN